MFSNQAITKFHLVQTSAQVLVLLLCGGMGLANPTLYNHSQMIDIVCCLVLVCIGFSLLRPESPQPTRWQMISHYLVTLTLCYTLPISLAILTKTLNYYHLIDPSIWMFLLLFYSFIIYIPMAKLALSRVRNNWGRILLMIWAIFSAVIRGPLNIANSLHYSKPLMQMNNSGFSGISVLIIITLVIMPNWKIQKLHFSFSRKSSLWIDVFCSCLVILHG